MNEKFRIALYMPSLQGGGGERVMSSLANGLVDMGSKVDFLLAEKKGSFLTDLKEQVHICDLGAKSTFGSIPALVRFIRRERPHVLISALEHANLCALIARLFFGSQTKLIVTVHVAPSRWVLSVGWKDRLVAGLNRWLYRLADGVVAVSQGVAEDLKKNYWVRKDRVKVIYNPVIGNKLWKQMSEPSQAITGLDGEKYIIAVGNMVGHKDYPTLLKAFALMKDDGAFKLLILGDGPQRAALEQQIIELGLQGRVLLPGFVSNPYALIKKAQVYVLSSDWEALPTVVIEALAAGVAIVSTNCEYGPDEILKGGKYGVLVPVANPKALAEALRNVLKKGSVSYDPLEATVRFRIESASKEYFELSQMLTGSNRDGSKG